MPATADAVQARNQGDYNTVPNTVSSISVGTSSATTAGALANYAGRWIWLKARVGTITVLRGASTVVAGVGLVLPPGIAIPFYVSSSTNADHRLSHISDTASSYLDILSDSEAG
jgi:hypothetical protein